jgi:putative OPT family oligopeptide transporter
MSAEPKPSESPPTEAPKFQSYVPASVTDMKEFTFRAALLGLVMTGILGAANAYLGLRAGMTIAATYPAAVIAMAVLKLMKGTILEENMARTMGSIGESVAAGAVFTIPAFVIAGVWPEFDFQNGYFKSVALMIVGGMLGILFIAVLRRVMVEDASLPFPESVAAAEIHKAGQRGGQAANILFANMGVGALVYLLGSIKLFNPSNEFHPRVGKLGASKVDLIAKGNTLATMKAGGSTTFAAPAISPAYMGVGYIIGPTLGALNFAGGVFAWGLLVPLLVYFLGPSLPGADAPGYDWTTAANAMWSSIVRPIAVGGMLVGASFTLFKMRKSLGIGLKRAIADLKKTASARASTERTQRDLSGKIVFIMMFLILLAMVGLYYYFTGTIGGSIVAAIIMMIIGFLFAAVSGNLVGMIGSSNNPISGLTLTALVISALVMIAIGINKESGVAAVLGVAAVICVSSAVAGDMLQDLKVGHILGGTPLRMQVGRLFSVVVSAAVLFFPLMILHKAYGFGTQQLPAPQAGLMALMTKGIVGGEMAWPLVIVGILMGLGLVMVQVKSPMLFSVGMYLPLETTFAIFVGGLIRWIGDKIRDRRKLNDAQKARVENAGVLTASGLIAGEALCGLVVALFIFLQKSKGWKILPTIFEDPPWPIAVVVLIVLAVLMIRWPLSKAGDPDEPAPPTAIM